MENIPSREQVAELLLSSGLDQQQIGLILDPMEQNSEIAEQSAEDKMDRVRGLDWRSLPRTRPRLLYHRDSRSPHRFIRDELPG